MPVIKTEFLVPIHDNDGSPFPMNDWEALEQRIVGLVGDARGYSWEEDIRGTWFSGGAPLRDASTRYIIALDSWEELPAWLDLVRWVRRRFRQLAMYYEVAGIPGILTS